MGKKRGENCHWTRDIIPVQQGDQEHYGRQIEVEACAAISKTENQWLEGDGTDKLSQLCTCVDAAYEVHPDLKIHNGRGMSYGYRLLHCKSVKHKLNAKSYTEAKVVRVSDYLPYNIWIFDMKLIITIYSNTTRAQ